MAADSLLAEPVHQVVHSTFKATQLINTPTVETPARKTLQFLIMHRFGKISDGSYALWGLDNADIRFGLDYGLTDRLSIGVGRSSVDKTYDASAKIKLLRQTTGQIPVSINFYELVTYTTFPPQDEKPYLSATDRTTYTSQLLIARKFSSRLSLQLTPTFIHFNLVPDARDRNNLFDLGIGGRFKITKRMSVVSEYNLLPAGQTLSYKSYNSLSAGIDIETGGHVFQFVFSNSRGMVGPQYISGTAGRWQDGDIYFGFNISRVFNFNRKR